MRFLIAVLLFPTFAFAKGIEGTNWKVKSYKIIGDESTWSTEEAEAVAGKSVSITKNQFKIGGTACKLKITSAVDDRRWTVGETNPCTGDKLKGNVYMMDYENCEARFPAQVAMPNEKQAVAFGDGISICLEKR